MHAAMKSKVEVMELLLSKGANIEAADKVIILKLLIRVLMCIYVAMIPHKHMYIYATFFLFNPQHINYTVYVYHYLSHYFT
jgi:hypothetical protein